jgi:branched-chain amino acid transport system permease protein
MKKDDMSKDGSSNDDVTGASYRAIAVVIVVLGVLPLVLTSNVWLNFFGFALVVALAAQGWNLLGGYGGQFSFGHAVFFGTGAYAMALLQVRAGLNAWVALPLSIALGALVGVFIGTLSFRANLRGSYFALVTLAFAEVFRVLANAWSFTGGAAGVLVPLQPGIVHLQLTDKRSFYWLALAFVAATMLLTAAIARTRFGAYLIAVRENEEAARALGANALRVKLMAIALSGAVTAAAGALYTQKFQYVDSKVAYGAWISVDALLGAIVGGIGTVLGPVLGTLALLGLGEITKVYVTHWASGAVAGIDLVIFGVLLIVCVAWAPRGIVGLAQDLWRKFGARQ